MIERDIEYEPNISELIDILSILQIKEVKVFKNKQNIKKQIKNARSDLKILLKNNQTKLDSKMIRKIFLVGIINLLVWQLKDNMLIESKNYNKYLKKALELNTIRNAAYNIMMKNFNEFDETRMRNETLSKINRNWHKFLIKRVKNL
mgnify:CR=1 FL=1